MFIDHFRRQRECVLCKQVLKVTTDIGLKSNKNVFMCHGPCWQRLCGEKSLHLIRRAQGWVLCGDREGGMLFWVLSLTSQGSRPHDTRVLFQTLLTDYFPRHVHDLMLFEMRGPVPPCPTFSIEF